MTDRELIEVCHKQFLFLAELSRHVVVSEGRKNMSSRAAIEEEATSAADVCRAHLDARCEAAAVAKSGCAHRSP